jgi:hypothetical protein
MSAFSAEIVHRFSVSRFEHRANVLQVAGVSRPCCQQVAQIALAKWFRCDGGLITRSITCELMMPSVKQMRQTSRPSFLACTETRSSQPFWQSGNFAWRYRSRRSAQLVQLLVEFACTNCLNQRINHSWQLFDRRHDDCRLALFKLDAL